jgi:hypothetical protein
MSGSDNNAVASDTCKFTASSGGAKNWKPGILKTWSGLQDARISGSQVFSAATSLPVRRSTMWRTVMAGQKQWVMPPGLTAVLHPKRSFIERLGSSTLRCGAGLSEKYFPL